jgi:hypothetical protein
MLQQCVDAKINTLEFEGKCSPSHGKSTKSASEFWPEIDKGENKVKFESVSVGIPNISHLSASAGFADTVNASV